MKKSVYICRKVLNSDEIRAWAKRQGFETCLHEHDMHVTIAFDKKKHDWRTLPFEAETFLDIENEDERSMEEFNGGAVVLEIYSKELTTRWAELVQSGLYWKWPDYRPHITITYKKPEGMDVSKLTPFDGVIQLGPEIVDQVIETWTNDNEEDDLT